MLYPEASVETPMNVTIDGFEYRYVVSMIQDERGLFIEHFHHETSGEDSMVWALRLTFWTRGIKGDLRCQGAERANLIVNKRGEIVTKYVAKSDWATYHHCWFHDNPNWAIRGPRGNDARRWKIQENQPIIQSVKPFVWGNNDPKIGTPGESFKKFYTFLKFAPNADLVEWVKEDKALDDERGDKWEARYKANLAKKRARTADKRAEREEDKKKKKAKVE